MYHAGGSALLEVSIARKAYLAASGERLDVIRQLAFTLRHGEMAAFVGPSGCGKTTMLRGAVTAVEVHAGRAQALAKTVGPNVRVVNVDARELDDSGFDRAIVDAPCSGLGVLARRPDLRWRAQPLPELQLELLRAAAVRPVFRVKTRPSLGEKRRRVESKVKRGATKKLRGAPERD